MNKVEIIERYGIEEYKRRSEKKKDYRRRHLTLAREQSKEWSTNNPEKVIAHNRENSHKGGKRYERMLEYHRTGIQGERKVIRATHGERYRLFKQIIAPESQIHHQWIPETADYKGVALVEKDQHMHGFIDVIQILEGEITLFTEAEIRGGLA